jgi:hypothetical protein
MEVLFQYQALMPRIAVAMTLLHCGLNDVLALERHEVQILLKVLDPDVCGYNFAVREFNSVVVLVRMLFTVASQSKE